MFNALVNLEPVQRSEDGCDNEKISELLSQYSYAQNSSESVEGDLFETFRRL